MGLCKTALIVFVLTSTARATEDPVVRKAPEEWKDEILKLIESKPNDKITNEVKPISEDLEELSQFIPSGLLKKSVESVISSPQEFKPLTVQAMRDLLPLVTPEIAKKIISRNQNSIIKTNEELLVFLTLGATNTECDPLLVEQFKRRFPTAEEKECFFNWALYAYLQEDLFFRNYWKNLLAEVWKVSTDLTRKERLMGLGVADLMGNLLDLPFPLLEEKIKNQDNQIHSACAKTRLRSQSRDSVLEGFSECIQRGTIHKFMKTTLPLGSVF